MKKCVIFDIDGTLANCEHRRNLLPNWESFFDAMTEDTPNEPVIWLGEILSKQIDLFVFSGRPNTHRQQTDAWLSRYCPKLYSSSQALLMREKDDYRSDVIVKKEMLSAIRSLGYEPLFVIDDRQSVVDMWRDEGVTCLQCAPGDFDKPKYNKGTLSLLVGPSGAGKTTWIKDNNPNMHILSSDSFRGLLCGDFKDQSKNNQVFRVIHETAKTLINNGVDVLIDATHIKRKDRLESVKCAGGGHIQYIVIDRPLDEKRATSGWRGEVKIKGLPLVDKHHQVFQQNLKDILDGDGLSNVKVIDCRKV